VRFEWNARKAAASLRKQGVSFDEAASVFFDPLSATATIRITPSTKGVS
jgi:uncharacterized DUF497 family protein